MLILSLRHCQAGLRGDPRVAEGGQGVAEAQGSGCGFLCQVVSEGETDIQG